MHDCKAFTALTINIPLRHKVYATLPVLGEVDNIEFIIDNLLDQQEVDLHLIICVNQPDEWWDMESKAAICENNRKTLEFIKALDSDQITCIDKSSRGKGWIGRRHGVGWARKTAMDLANEMAQEEDIIISVDADTFYPEYYFKSVVESLSTFPDAAGLSVPYYHPLTGDEITDRCVLRYEVYMRNYALNMLLIRNPYCFSAIGSGMACTAAQYRKVRGLTPKMSGEDFYFVQKLRKAGNIIIDNKEVIYPASRFSDRVYFGTGPAMIKGRTGNWSSYPIYDQDLFLDIKSTYDLFPELYTSDIPTPLDDVMIAVCEIGNKGIADIWDPLRKNCSGVAQFIKAAMQKIDGLRILQYLKVANQQSTVSDEDKLINFITSNLNPGIEIIDALNLLSVKGFEKIPVTEFNLIRDFMFVHERKLQKQIRLA